MQSGRGWEQTRAEDDRRLSRVRVSRTRVVCDRVLGVDRELDGSSELERDLRTFRFQEGSTEFLDELRT